MRLDADLLARTPSYLNTLKDRELDLRGHKIPAIENLGVTKDQLDSIDFTDNAISTLSNFPLLRRLQHLLLSNNPVRSISQSVPTSLPNLRTLILTNTAFTKESLGGLGDVLGRCHKLETLCLKGSPVAEEQYYKDWLVYKCKKLRSLDFERIKDKDRAQAKALFVSPTGEPTPLAASFSAGATGAPALATGARTFEPGQEPTVEAAATTGKAGRLLSKDEKERVRAAIEAAESVDEIRRLQRMLAQGFVPTEKDLKALAKGKAGAGAGAGGEAMEL